MASLKIKGVDCYYSSHPILQGIEFTADEGEFIGILGPNGAGKTTLLKTMSRVLKPRDWNSFTGYSRHLQYGSKGSGKEDRGYPSKLGDILQLHLFRDNIDGKKPSFIKVPNRKDRGHQDCRGSYGDRGNLTSDRPISDGDKWGRETESNNC